MYIRIGNIEIQFDNANVDGFFKRTDSETNDFVAICQGDEENNSIFIQHKDRKDIEVKLIPTEGDLTFEITEKKK